MWPWPSPSSSLAWEYCSCVRVQAIYSQEGTMTFQYIGGTCRILRIPTLVQCTSVFLPNSRKACITLCTHFKEGVGTRITWLPANDAKEGNFFAVYESIRYCLQNNVNNIHVEHDSEFVVRALTSPMRHRHTYSLHRMAILGLAGKTQWTAISCGPNTLAEGNAIVEKLTIGPNPQWNPWMQSIETPMKQLL